MTKIQISIAVEAAARLLYENPSWSYEEVINKVKEMAKDEKVS